MLVKKTKIAVSIVTASLLAIPALANAADDLNVSNQTKYGLSFKVNGVCREAFSVDPYSIKSMPQELFYGACKANSSPCEFLMYDAKGCQGKVMALINYYIAQKYVELYGYGEHNLSIGVSGFNIFLAEPIPGQETKK